MASSVRRVPQQGEEEQKEEEKAGRQADRIIDWVRVRAGVSGWGNLHVVGAF